MTIARSSDAEQRQRAWSVYLDHLDLFHSILRRTGPWEISEGVDLVNDFIVERLPKALDTYDPSRPVRPWLYAVFDRYAKRKRAAVAKIAGRAIHLGHLIDEQPGRKPASESAAPQQARRFASAIEELPDELRQCLRAYFVPGPGAGSFRDVAARTGISRYECKRRLFAGLGAILERLKPYELFTAEEFQIAHLYLDEAAIFPEQSPDRGPDDVLRSGLEVLLSGVAGALSNTESPIGGNMPSNLHFDRLVAAIRTRDVETIESQRKHWDEIGRFVESNPESAKEVGLSDDDVSVLILWLGTPPAPRPIPWTEFPKSRLKDDREHRTELVEHLLSSWKDRRILPQLDRALRDFRYREEWMKLARECFERDRLPAPATDEQWDACVRGVLGYSAMIAQRLLSQRGRGRAWLKFGFHDGRLVLIGPDESEFPVEGAAAAVSFGGFRGDARWFADAVSLSLPAHPDVLPDVEVAVDRDDCRLIAVVDDHLSRLVGDRLERESREFRIEL